MNPHILDAMHHLPTWVPYLPTVMMVLGFLLSYLFYIRKPYLPVELANQHPGLYRFFLNKWYFDELYDFVFVKGAKAVGDLFWKIGDVKIIDGLGPNGAAWASLKSAARLAKVQSGYVYHYAFVMLLGVAGFLAYAIYAWGA
jgi:NADH-quinone oxidoreductase subunit L